MTLTPSEAQTEAAVRDLFLRSGWYPVKTDSGMVARATRGRKTRGTLPIGFPDDAYFKGLAGTRLCLAALLELKSPTGRVRLSQQERHAELAMYGIQVSVVRDVRECQEVIAQARAIEGALKGVTR